MYVHAHINSTMFQCYDGTIRIATQCCPTHLLHWLCTVIAKHLRGMHLFFKYHFGKDLFSTIASLQLEVLWCLDDVHAWPRFVKGCVMSSGTSASYFAYYIKTLFFKIHVCIFINVVSLGTFVSYQIKTHRSFRICAYECF